MDNLPHDDFQFIRLGEDYDDIETRGSYRCNPQPVRITREIASDGVSLTDVKFDVIKDIEFIQLGGFHEFHILKYYR